MKNRKTLDGLGVPYGWRELNSRELIEDGDCFIARGEFFSASRQCSTSIGFPYKGGHDKLDSDTIVVTKRANPFRFEAGDKVKVVGFDGHCCSEKTGTITAKLPSEIKNHDDIWCVDFSDPLVAITIAGNKLEKLPEPIYVGEYEVKRITDKGFEVGCQTITWEQYEAVGKLRPFLTK